MTIPDLIGYMAAFLTTFAYLPQVIKVLKTGDTRAISLGMYAAMSCGIFLWFIYGLLIESWPVILCNGTTLALAMSILMMKVKNLSNEN